MTTKTLNGKTILIVEVPADAILFDIDKNKNGFQFVDFFIGEHKYETYDLRPLPKGQWSILGRAKDIGDEQARELVEIEDETKGVVLYKIFGKLYNEPQHERVLSTSDPLKAFQSWLKAEGIKETDLLLIKNS